MKFDTVVIITKPLFKNYVKDDISYKKIMERKINVGELYSNYPNAINAFYDYLDLKYSIKDYVDRFKLYLPNDIMFMYYITEYFDSINQYIHIKPMIDLESNQNNYFKVFVNNVDLGISNDRFSCKIKAIKKILLNIENV